MLSSHIFLCLPCLLPPFTVPCKMVFWQAWWTGDMTIPLQFASLYNVTVSSFCPFWYRSVKFFFVCVWKQHLGFLRTLIENRQKSFNDRHDNYNINDDNNHNNCDNNTNYSERIYKSWRDSRSPFHTQKNLPFSITIRLPTPIFHQYAA